MIIILLLVVLTASVCAGELQVNVSQAVYQAEENSDITMEWTFTPIMPLTDLNIWFSLSVSEYGPFKWVYYLRDGVEQPEYRDEQFTGRVQLDKDELRKGNIRLHLSSLRTNDSGSYWCRVHTRDGVRITRSSLNVSAVTRPPEEPEPTEGGGTVVVGSVAAPLVVPVVIVVLVCLACCLGKKQSPDKNQTDTSVLQSGEETTYELESAGIFVPSHTVIS